MRKSIQKKAVNFSIYDSKIFKAYELFLSLKFVIITKKIRLFEQLQSEKDFQYTDEKTILKNFVDNSFAYYKKYNGYDEYVNRLN